MDELIQYILSYRSPPIYSPIDVPKAYRVYAEGLGKTELSEMEKRQAALNAVLRDGPFWTGFWKFTSSLWKKT